MHSRKLGSSLNYKSQFIDTLNVNTQVESRNSEGKRHLHTQWFMEVKVPQTTAGSFPSTRALPPSERPRITLLP